MLTCVFFPFQCVITYYLPKVLVESIGMTREMALLISGIITTEYFLASLVQIWLVDKFNRRTLMFISSWGEIITMVILAVTTWQGSSPAGIAGAVMIALYNTFYAFGWLPIPFILPAEVCTLRLRAKGAALASVGAWIIEFMVVQITPVRLQFFFCSIKRLVSISADFCAFCRLRSRTSTGVPTFCSPH
jgi:hypothetical protein